MFRLPGLENERNIRGEHSSICFPFYFSGGEAFLSEVAIFSQALRLCPRVPVLLVSGKERVPPPSSRTGPVGAGIGAQGGSETRKGAPARSCSRHGGGVRATPSGLRENFHPAAAGGASLLRRPCQARRGRWDVCALNE